MSRSRKQRMISRFIGQEAKANARRKKKRPWKQVVAIGLARARKAEFREHAKALTVKPYLVPKGSSYSGYRASVGKRKGKGGRSDWDPIATPARPQSRRMASGQHYGQFTDRRKK